MDSIIYKVYLELCRIYRPNHYFDSGNSDLIEIKYVEALDYLLIRPSNIFDRDFSTCKFNGDYLLKNCSYNETLYRMCKENGIKITNDPHWIKIYADLQDRRNHKLKQILE
jgi:hypothetical protein